MKKYNYDVPDRAFMKALIKHTGIAIALLISIAAYSTLTYAQSSHIDVSNVISETKSVDKVDLDKYSGQWYEIARLPMYFQRKCASDVTANYVLNKDVNGQLNSVDVINECSKADGSKIKAEGLAKPANDTGSQLIVTFLPSWLRWLPFGRADYWVLQLDEDYQSALVGTPDNKYLWILSRKPTLSQSTFNKYKNVASNQGYDLSELKITKHTGNTKTII